MLKYFENCLINKSDTNRVYIYIDENQIKNINGSWENDMKYIKMNMHPLLETETEYKSRLIMGFGPSASGKTHWAETIINIFNEINPNEFSNNFLTIDGGIMREYSNVYQKIKEHVKSKGYGLKKLAGNDEKSLFNTDNIKINVIKYLSLLKKEKEKEKEKENKTFPFSLYVPDTLSSCITKKCKSVYDSYIIITGDQNWIGLYIYQHLDSCPYEKDYKCETTTKSGCERQIEEGKQYRNRAYRISKIYGKNQLMDAPGGRFKIHNSGSIDRNSIIHEYPINNNYLLNNKIIEERKIIEEKNKNIEEKNKNIEEKNNFIYITNETEDLKQQLKQKSGGTKKCKSKYTKKRTKAKFKTKKNNKNKKRVQSRRKSKRKVKRKKP